jgi:hypothetical protein
VTGNCTSIWEISLVSDLHTRTSVVLNISNLDHILSLQQGLAHYEWMMAQSHPIYLSQLDIQAVKAKSGRGKAAIILSVVAVGVVLELTPIGKRELDVKRYLY